MSGCFTIQTQQQKELILKTHDNQIWDDKMYELTALYHGSIYRSIMDKSKQGIRELDYNLSLSHFEFNLPNTGASEMCAAWLIQMCLPESMYLCEGLKNGVISYRDHFQGLKFDVCNNKHAKGSSFFSVHLTW